MTIDYINLDLQKPKKDVINVNKFIYAMSRLIDTEFSKEY